jgi:hypothetical protein
MEFINIGSQTIRVEDEFIALFDLHNITLYNTFKRLDYAQYLGVVKNVEQRGYTGRRSKIQAIHIKGIEQYIKTQSSREDARANVAFLEVLLEKIKNPDKLAELTWEEKYYEVLAELNELKRKLGALQ